MIKPSKVTRRERADLMAVELVNSELKWLRKDDWVGVVLRLRYYCVTIALLLRYYWITLTLNERLGFEWEGNNIAIHN